MLEWLSVPESDWVDPDGNPTRVKFMHEFPVMDRLDTVITHKRDIDLIAFEEMGSELESLRLMEFNAVKMVEYDFDVTRMPTLDIPR